MISFIWGIQNITQMNTCETNNHGHREQTWVAKGERFGGGMEWEVGVSFYIQSG